MTKRDLFIILIKLIGTVGFITSVVSFPFSVIQTMIIDFDYFSEYFLPQFGLQIVLLLAYLLFIFKANNIVDMLRLDQGFEEDYIYVEELNVAGIAKLSIIISGFLMLANNLPEFIQIVLSNFSDQNATFNASESEKLGLVGSGLKLLISYLMIAQYHRIIQILKLEEIKPKAEKERLDDVLDDISDIHEDDNEARIDTDEEE